MFTSSKDLIFFINKIKKESSLKVLLNLLNHRAYSQYQLTGKARERLLKAQMENGWHLGSTHVDRCNFGHFTVLLVYCSKDWDFVSKHGWVVLFEQWWFCPSPAADTCNVWRCVWLSQLWGGRGGGMVCYRYLLGAGWGCCEILDNGQDSPHPTLAVEQRYQAADVHSAEAWATELETECGHSDSPARAIGMRNAFATGNGYLNHVWPRVWHRWMRTEKNMKDYENVALKFM